MLFPCAGTGFAAGAEPPNISTNGFPNCNKSSDALDAGADCPATSLPPNKSTIFVLDAGGDDKNGLFVGPVGEDTLD